MNETISASSPAVRAQNASESAWMRGLSSFARSDAAAESSSAKLCRLCTCQLGLENEDDLDLDLCGSCKTRPEARRLGLQRPSSSSREFTEAEKALIRKVHGYIPAQQLLVILNERLACDLGPDALQYTMEQLHSEIGISGSAATPVGGHGWGSLRKLLAQAKRGGVLDHISEQTINDFAVVFSLNAKQVLSLKDIVLQATGSQS